MKIDFRAMTDSKKRTAYQALWDRENFGIFEDRICRGLYRGKESNNSYMFDVGDDKAIGLADVFGITNRIDRELFVCKFKQACSGDGNEMRRINTLHSSSLCALLFFYNVTEDNPLTIMLDSKAVTFTKSYFEYQNTVIRGHNPSNMDIVLIGADENGKNVILFLESKFMEYYYDIVTSVEFSAEYLENLFSKSLYSENVVNRLGYTMKKDGQRAFLESHQKSYLAGVKQLVSHFVGIMNLYTGKENGDARYPEVLEYIRTGADIFLAEIVFDYKIGDLSIGHSMSAYKSYEAQYGKVAKEINSIAPRGCFATCGELLTYSQLRKTGHRFDDRVIKFYFGV